MGLVTVLMLAGGTVLIYAGVKGYDPRDVIKDALKGKDNPGDPFTLPPTDPKTNNPLIPGGNAENFFGSVRMPEEDSGSARI